MPDRRVNLSVVMVLAVTAQLAAGSALGQAAPRAAAAKTYTAAQFYQTTSYSLSDQPGVAFSPDGRSLLVSSDATGVFNAYAQPVNGGAPVALTTSTDVAHFGSSFFPNDGRLIYVAEATAGGSELTHVYVREEDGSVRDLTPGENLKADFLGWSADGETFYLFSNGRDAEAFDVLAVDARTYDTRIAFQNPGGFFPSSLSRDGRWLALDKPLTSANSDIYLADLQSGGEPRLITEHQGDVAFSTYDFTADSTGLIYATNELSEFNQAWRYDLVSGDKTPFLTADWDVQFVSFSPSGRYRVSAINADASTQLTLLDTRSNQPVVFADLPEGSLETVRFSRDESQVAFRLASDTTPGDVYVASLPGGAARKLATALNPEIDRADLVEASIIRFPGAGGVDIPGVLYRPHGVSAAAAAPAVVLMHGGPGGQSTRGYDAEVQHLVNHGYVVLLANNRGSSGYGKTFFHMDDRKHGEGDLQDVVDAGAWLRAQDWVADDQVAVMGGSYGGYLVAAALAFHPEAFEAGVNVFGVTNWVRTLESIPPWWGAQKQALYDEMGDPATDAERHRRISPLFHSARIRRPLLVVQGANDPRVLQVESDELVAAVRANNVPVEYVLFPDEGHGFLKRENRITAQEAYLKFLDEHVRD